MKFTDVLSYPIIFLAMILLLTYCTKEDSEKVSKEDLTLKMIDGINADSLKADVIWLQNMGARFSLADNHRDVALKIKKKFQDIGYANAVLDSFNVVKTFRSVTYEQINYNVIASIEGTDYPDSVCIMGGHYDDILSTSDLTVVPGANDNASGTSAVLEVARVMKKNKYRPKSTIMFIAFGAEEIGLLGSNDFAANPDDFSQKIRFMLNSDMIAYETSSVASDWYLNILDYNNSHSLRIEAEEICRNHTLLNTFNNNTDNARSDSYPFFTNGYKALFFFSGDGDPNYHSLNDVVSNCNFGYCTEVVKLQCALLANKN